MAEKPLVLVVEDEALWADKIAAIIRETGNYETEVAHNGIEAFEILNKNKRFLGLAQNKVRCIILDLKMPEMDGLHFIKKLRQEEPFYKFMPIIVLTAYEDEEKWVVTTSPRMGSAVAYLKKPFKKEELVDTLDRVFNEEIGHMIDETREKKYKRLEQLEKEKGKEYS